MDKKNKMYFHRMKSLLSIFLISIFFSSSCYSKGHELKFRVEGIQNKEIILAHYFNKSIYPDDTLTSDERGTVVFSGEGALPQGMYILYLPSGKYFEFIVGEDQEFSIETDTLDFIHHAKIKGSEDNELFFDFQKYMISKKEEHQDLLEVLRNPESEENKEEARKKLKAIGEERKEKVKRIVADNPKLFVSTFFKATLDIEVPDPPLLEDGSIDSSWQYRYYKNHFFDNFDPHDGRLLRTPLYEDKILYYLEKVVIQIPDTLIKEVDYLLEGAREDSVLFRYLLVTLFNHYGNTNIMGLDAVQVHLAANYYLTEAWWINDDFREELIERVAALQPLILGNISPNIELLFVPADHFKAAQSDSALKSYPHVGKLMHIHDLPGEYIVLVFWEANCSHCKKAIPAMYRIYKEQLEPKGIQVVSISTLFGEEGKVKWVDFVNKYQLYDWWNAWNPYDYQYKIKYDIRTTPQIFILDKERKIIGKRIGPEQVPEFIEMYDQHQKSNQE